MNNSRTWALLPDMVHNFLVRLVDELVVAVSTVNHAKNCPPAQRSSACYEQADSESFVSCSSTL